MSRETQASSGLQQIVFGLLVLAAAFVCGCYVDFSSPHGNDNVNDIDGGMGGDGGDTDADAGPDACVGWCGETCAEAAQRATHVGCLFYPTPTTNSNLEPPFDDDFGVLVFNPTDSTALVSVSTGVTTAATQTVSAGGSAAFNLPLDTGLKLTINNEQSVQVADGAYRLLSDVPVAAYQFNPLNYELGGEFSYTNDAAMLLPDHAFGQEHIVLSRPTFGVRMQSSASFSFIPGYFAVVGTQMQTEVTIHFTAHTEPLGNGQSFSPGDEETFVLDAGEVLQIVSGLPGSCVGTSVTNDCGYEGQMSTCHFCDQGSDYDLTGTRISSTAAVAVFSGHACSMVPFNFYACDHLVEQVPPVSAWGRQVVVSRTVPQHDVGFPEEPNVIRVVSGSDTNIVVFDPPQTPGVSVTLDQGQYVEFESHEDFVVSGSGRILVGQFLVGQSVYSNVLEYRGDPSLGLVLPVEQYQTFYATMMPATFPLNYVNIVKAVGPGAAAVLIDGNPLAEALYSAPIGTTDYAVARVELTGTAHTFTSAAPFSIFVYGFASHASYMYTGGAGTASLPD